MSFISDPGQLQAGIFTVYQARYGAQTAININFIPDLLHYIKQQLTSQELIRLEDYHLQNYLMQLSITYKQKKTLSALTEKILVHIRSNNNFWYRHNNQQQLDQQQQLKHHAIVCYHKDIECLKSAFSSIDNHSPFTPSYQRKTTETYTFQLLHNTAEPYFGTRQPLNHLAYIPLFLIQKMSSSKRQVSLELQKGQNKLIQQQANKEEDKVANYRQITSENVRKMMQQCIIFLLSNKSRNISKVKQSCKENSEDAEQQIEKSSSQSQNNESISQQQTILDQFLRFVQNQPSLPKFPNSHHMELLTLNLINSCKKACSIFLQPELLAAIESSEKKTNTNRQQNLSSLKSVSLDTQAEQILSMISQKHLTEAEIEILSINFLKNWHKVLKFITFQMRKREQSTLQMKGWLNSPQEIAQVKEAYQQMLDNPQFVQLTKYRAMGSGIPWKQEDYLKFLKGLNEFLNIPTNNKKIASSMGQDYEPNHVKHVKAVYLTVMKERMDRGQCGGGKRGKSLSKSDFIEKDISNFSMRWFEKGKKIKKRKPKRKRRNSGSQDCEEQPDSEY